ncbi:MAG: PTS sugar transporter subunit IIB [Clostridiaceae bacterium]
MKKIMLVCCAGMSTSLLVKKMEDAATKENLKVEIFAVGEADVKNHEDVDVVLLGPQVRYLLKKMEKLMVPKGIPVKVIDSILYGTMNGEEVLKQAVDMIK